MAALEGNELVNIESVTALMTLFGAKYYAGFYDGSIRSGNGLKRQSADYKSLSSDGTTFSLTQTGSSDQDKKTEFTVTFGEDSLWKAVLGVQGDTANNEFRIEYNISVSDGSLVIKPSSNTVSSSSNTRDDYFDAYLRVKKGTTLTVNCTDASPRHSTNGFLLFDMYRIC